MDVNLDLGGVTLQTPRLLLRMWEKEDLEDLYAYAKDPEVGPRAGWEPHPSLDVSREILNMFIQGKKTFALELKREKRVIGALSVDSIQKREEEPRFSLYLGKELGYVLSQAYWNQGLMSEALEEVIAYLFDFGLDYLVCGHFVENEASRRVIEKTGFTYFKSVDYQDQRGIHHETLLYYQWNPKKNEPREKEK